MKHTTLSAVFICTLFLLTSPLVALAQPDNTVKGEAFFEGSISFKVEVTGQHAGTIKELNDIVQMTWHLKDDNYIIQQTPSVQALQDPNRSAFFTTRLFIGDSNQIYSMDLEGRRAFKKEKGINYKPEKPPVAEPLGDSLKIAGYMCYGYKVTKGQQNIFYYISPQLRMNTALFRGKTQAKISFLTQGLNGCIPLKTVIKTSGYTASVTAAKVAPMKLPKEEFSIPPGFTIMGYDYRR